MLSHVSLFCDPTDCSPPAPLSMGFSRQEHWSRLPCPPPGDLLNPGIKPGSPVLQADSLPSELPGKRMNTGVGSPSLLQGIFLTQGLNGVSCLAGRFFTSWAAREALHTYSVSTNTCIGMETQRLHQNVSSGYHGEFTSALKMFFFVFLCHFFFYKHLHIFILFCNKHLYATYWA